MNDVIVKNPKLTIYTLKCSENQIVFAPLLENEEVLNHSRVSLKWLSKEMMLSAEAPAAGQSKHAFVIPRFDDEVYKYLHSLKVTIWGSPLIAYCSTKEKPLPEQPLEVYSIAFKDITVSFTGIDADVKEAEGRRIKLMGGKVSPDYSLAVDILIAKNCESTPKYRGACYWKKPICSLKIVDAMWRDSARHVSELVNKNRNDFALGLLTDCIISVSGIDMNERTVMGQAIEENGGKYVMDMERGVCTHLITEKTSGDKYKFALRWGDIRVVKPRWLKKCLDRKMRLPEEYYHPDTALCKLFSRDATEKQQSVVQDSVRCLLPASICIKQNLSIVNTPDQPRVAPANIGLNQTIETFEQQQPSIIDVADMMDVIPVDTPTVEEKDKTALDQKRSETQAEVVTIDSNRDVEKTAFNSIVEDAATPIQFSKSVNVTTEKTVDASMRTFAPTAKSFKDKPVLVEKHNTTVQENPNGLQNKTVPNDLTHTINKTINELTWQPSTCSVNSTLSCTTTNVAVEVDTKTEAPAASTAMNFEIKKEIVIDQEENTEDTVGLEPPAAERSQNEASLIGLTRINNIASIDLNVTEVFTQKSMTVDEPGVVKIKEELEIVNQPRTLEIDELVSTKNSTAIKSESETLTTDPVCVANKGLINLDVTKDTTQELVTLDETNVIKSKDQVALEQEALEDNGVKEFPAAESAVTNSPNKMLSVNQTHSVDKTSSDLNTANGTTLQSTSLNEAVVAESEQIKDKTSVVENEVLSTVQVDQLNLSTMQQTVHYTAQQQQTMVVNIKTEAVKNVESDVKSNSTIPTTVAQAPVYKSTIDIAHGAPEQDESVIIIDEKQNDVDITQSSKISTAGTSTNSMSSKNSQPLFNRQSQAAEAYMAGDTQKPRKMRLRINTANWTSKLINDSAEAKELNRVWDEDDDEVLSETFVTKALEKAAAKNPKAPLSTLNESQVPDEIRHCYRKSVFPIPQFSPMSVDEGMEDPLDVKENKSSE